MTICKLSARALHNRGPLRPVASMNTMVGGTEAYLCKWSTVCLAMLFTICMVSRCLAAEQSVITIDVPGARTTWAKGINAEGDIVGYYIQSGAETPNCGSGQFPCGFLLSKGKYSTFEASLGTLPMGINPDGNIVGSSFGGIPSFVSTRGFLLSKGVFTTIIAPGAFPYGFTVATGINPRGDIVGYYTVLSTPSRRGFLLRDGAFSDIAVPGASGTQPMGVSPRGDVVGSYTDSSLRDHGFLLSDGRFTTIDPPGALFTQAVGINTQGDIVGWFYGVTTSHGFLLRGGTFTNIDSPAGAFPQGINSSGDIVGYYTDSNLKGHGFLLSK
jgi:uncharacterized membrane protein